MRAQREMTRDEILAEMVYWRRIASATEYNRAYWFRHFAGLAMQMVYDSLGQNGESVPHGWKEDLPREAVNFAEALLAEIERREPERKE